MNPYGIRTMIKDPALFFGREAECRDLFTLLGSMQSCSVVGPRHIGKSSLLYHLTHIYGRALPESYVFAYIDLQELTGLGPDDFFFTAVERMARAGDLDVNLDRDGTLSGFRRFLARVADSERRLVLCCDEFEILSHNAQFGADFFTYLRGLCSNYNLALVTSSRDSLYDLCHQGNLQTSQFWNIFAERTLGLMPREEARALIVEPFSRAGMALTDDEIAFVLRVAGKHPMFIQMMCYHLFNLKSDPAARVNLERIRERFMEEASPHYAYTWNHLDETEQTALTMLAQGRETWIDDQTQTRLARSGLVDAGEPSGKRVSEGWKAFIEQQIGPLEEDDLPAPTSLMPPESLPESPAPEPVQLSNAYQIGRYQVQAALGQGGMATVFRAYDPNFKRDVAVKVVLSDVVSASAQRARFVREAQIIAALEHPAVVPVYDFGEIKGQLYLVMRLMTHGSLWDVLQQGPLSIKLAARILARLASALDEAHAQGVIHRDLKPANVLFDRYQNAFLSDFGIAQLQRSEVSLTRTGSIVGTPAYMSPEQIRGERNLDGRSDVYGLGVMLFEMLSGRIPFSSESPSQVLISHLQDPIPSLLDIRPNLPPSLDVICARALAKQSDERYRTAGEMALDFAAAIREMPR
jgi:hypothetical protein